MKKVKLGIYQHYSGTENLYKVVGEGRFSETLEEVVLYEQLHDNNPKFPKGTLWVRPKKMFLEKVEVNGKKVPRFKYLGDKLAIDDSND